MGDILTWDGLKDGGYYTLLVMLMWVIYKAGAAFFAALFDAEKGVVPKLTAKAVETLNQVQTSVAEQSAASQRHAEAADKAARAHRVTARRIDRIEQKLDACQAVHPPAKPPAASA